MEKAQKRLNQWLLRDLSLKGRVLITKAEGICRPTYTYTALSSYIHNKTVRDIDQCLFHFLWRNKTHYIRRSVAMNRYENGGRYFLDFSTLNNTFKINWIKQSLKKLFVESCTQSCIFRFGGLNFLLVCNYRIETIPSPLSKFHKQALLVSFKILRPC